MITPDLVRLSPNVNRDEHNKPLPLHAKTVIIHSTRSGKAGNPTEFAGTLNYMATPGTVSSHWVISRTGLAARVVEDRWQAWHAKEDNDKTFGIELEQPVDSDGFTLVQLDKLVQVSRGYVLDFGVPPVHATSSSHPGFVGHQETAQGRRDGKSDPGSNFPWPAFIGALAASVTPPLVLPTAAEVEHAAPWLAAAFYKQDRSLLHGYDAGVLERALAWYRSHA